MDKNGGADALKQAQGSIKDAIGKVTGNMRAQAEGRAEIRDGLVQRAADGAQGVVGKTRSSVSRGKKAARNTPDR